MTVALCLQRRLLGGELWAVFAPGAISMPCFLVRGPVEVGTDATFAHFETANAEFTRRLSGVLRPQEHWYRMPLSRAERASRMPSGQMCLAPGAETPKRMCLGQSSHGADRSPPSMDRRVPAAWSCAVSARVASTVKSQPFSPSGSHQVASHAPRS